MDNNLNKNETKLDVDTSTNQKLENGIASKKQVALENYYTKEKIAEFKKQNETVTIAKKLFTLTTLISELSNAVIGAYKEKAYKYQDNVMDYIIKNGLQNVFKVEIISKTDAEIVKVSYYKTQEAKAKGHIQIIRSIKSE